MRGSAVSMTVLRPRSAAEAVAAYLAEPKALPLAGGTDLMVAWNMGLFNGRAVLDLSGVGEWTRMRARANGLEIGALLTHAAIQEDATVRREFPLLALACATVGAAQIQNRGTLGGNIANASPAGDTFPALAVYEPTIRTAAAAGGRTIPFASIFAGVKKTTLKSSELIAAVELPFLRPRPTRQVFRKVGTRAAQAISKTVAAGLLWLDRSGKVTELRFALGSVAPTVKRLATVEESVRGQRLSDDVVEKACGLVARDIQPIDDIRSTREYRLHVSRNILRAFLKSSQDIP